jgi:hypothetical protein
MQIIYLEEDDMCDYSLMGVPNRLVREGEELVYTGFQPVLYWFPTGTYRFPTGTLGLASPADLTPSEPMTAQPRSFWRALEQFFGPLDGRAVCAVSIPPGAVLSLHDIPVKLQHELSISSDEGVVFTQTSFAVNHYRDAIRFKRRPRGPAAGSARGPTSGGD